jgi:hypothetical protein
VPLLSLHWRIIIVLFALLGPGFLHLAIRNFPPYHDDRIMDRTVQGLKIALPALGFIPFAGEYLKSSLELVLALYDLTEVIARFALSSRLFF